MQDDTYNGWKNHATWAVNLHLSNDEPLYRETLERTRDAIENPPHTSEYWNEEETRRYNVADMLKDWCGEMVDMFLQMAERGGTEPKLLIMDLCAGYLSDVDWNEIADAWIEQVTEQTAV